MVDKKFIDKMESPFLNRFEKIIIKFKELLNEFQKLLSNELMKNEYYFKYLINKKISIIIAYLINYLNAKKRIYIRINIKFF